MTGSIVAGLLLAHLVGDYVLQTHWMAVEKVKRWGPALAHAAAYTAPHVLVTRNVWALLVIGGTHAVLDRYRVAKYVVWAKNQLAPRAYRPTVAELRETGTGYQASTPVWLSTWLMILTDNTLHLMINFAAVWWVTTQ